MVWRREDSFLPIDARRLLMRLGTTLRYRIWKGHPKAVCGHALSQPAVFSCQSDVAFFQPLCLGRLDLSQCGRNKFQHLDRSSETQNFGSILGTIPIIVITKLILCIAQKGV